MSAYQPPPQKTIVDHLAILVCPLVIMVMVGSLALFLAKIGYTGRYVSRVNWALCWFVLASVLTSRIGIQYGSERASIYGLFLGGAIAVFFWRFLGFGMPLYILLAILCFIWWCTSQLTWDCTMIDDDEDSSGQGLLEASGLDGNAAKEAQEETKKHQLRRKRKLWWQHLFGSQANRKGQPHAPGIWIILFSLLALPLFGIGQLKFGSADSPDRRFGFMLLGIYVAASLTLLLLTSFLGLRRYLRQRRLEMPAIITGSWMIYGVILAALVMGACLLLPRPNAQFTLTAFVNKVSQEIEQKASKYSMLGGESAQGEGKRKGEGEGEPKGEEQDKGSGGEKKGESKGKTGAGEEKGEGQGKQKSEPGEQKSDAKKGEVSNEGQKDGEGQRPENPTEQPTLTPQEEKTNWIKWIIYGLLALTALYLLWRYRQIIKKTLAAMWQAICKFFRELLDSFKRVPRPEALESKQNEIPKRRFSEFMNPFIAGKTMSSDELVAYTFEALQCWASEHGAARAHGETPYEFAGRLGNKEPMLAEDARQLAWFYTRMAYAQQSPPESVVKNARSLWEFMSVAGVVEVR
ncbi:MAG TPA: DUF4129 domain-containing protein [Verrucomicrobiae bacterium]